MHEAIFLEEKIDLAIRQVRMVVSTMYKGVFLLIF